jgi:hypothetical protein
VNSAEQIRNAISQVFDLRVQSRSDASLATAIRAVKRFQARRFSVTYRDLLSSTRFKMAAGFFMSELYGDRDFERRDAQFARIAGALQRLLPASTQATAVTLAQLHFQTERLDHLMGIAMASNSVVEEVNTSQYVASWRLVGRRNDRLEQLNLVLSLGRDLAQQIHVPGLRTLLHAMRLPAAAAGLMETQRFLQTGFDAFQTLEHHDPGAAEFLSHIDQRESRIIEALFDRDSVGCVFESIHCSQDRH